MLAKVGFDAAEAVADEGAGRHVLGAQPLTPALAAPGGVLPGADTREGLLGWCVAATVVLFLLSWALGVATAYANIGFGQRMVYDLATDLFSHLQRLSLRFHSRQLGGRLDPPRHHRLRLRVGHRQGRGAAVRRPRSSASSAMFVVMWRLEPRLTLLSLAVVPCMVAGACAAT